MCPSEEFYHLPRVIEVITGVGFESLMQDRIFEPLGMHSTTYLWRDDANDQLQLYTENRA